MLKDNQKARESSGAEVSALRLAHETREAEARQARDEAKQASALAERLQQEKDQLVKANQQFNVQYQELGKQVGKIHFYKPVS